MSQSTPEPSAMEAEGIPDIANPDAHGSESLVEPPHEFPMAVEEFGTTAQQQHDGEPLDGRLAREEPDVLAQVDLPPMSPLATGAQDRASDDWSRVTRAPGPTPNPR